MRRASRVVASACGCRRAEEAVIGRFSGTRIVDGFGRAGLFAGGMHHAEDEVPDADSIEMVIASADEPVPDELAAQTPAVISRWQQAEEASSSSGKLDKAGEEVAAYVSRSYRIPMTEALQWWNGLSRSAPALMWIRS